MSKKILVVALFVSAFLELIFSIGGFAAPAFVMSLFKIRYDEQTAFLGHVLSWLLLFVALTAFFAFRLVRRNDNSGWSLSYLLGLWWVGIGLAIFVFYGRPDNLVMDSLKGAVILGAAWRSRPGQ